MSTCLSDLLLDMERLSRHYQWNRWHQRSFDLLLNDIWSMAGTEDALKLDAWHDMWHDAEKKAVVPALGVKGGVLAIRSLTSMPFGPATAAKYCEIAYARWALDENRMNRPVQLNNYATEQDLVWWLLRFGSDAYHLLQKLRLIFPDINPKAIMSWEDMEAFIPRVRAELEMHAQ
ncbi:unnamed protein product [Symbiodinium sp. CCMP2592]|nr:unnamed protein product [Symbiodinium sp. CCMP2592]